MARPPVSPDDTTGSGTDAQRALSDYIRDPDHAPAPVGIEARQLKVYHELFFNNLQSMLAGNFPVIHRILSTSSNGDRWTPLIRDFYREHPSRTPLFTELAREFLRYLQHRADTARGDPPWLPELAHYEWVELALQISENVVDAPGESPAPTLAGIVAGEPLTRVALRLSPLAWPFAYRWPVHRLAPDYLPESPPAEPTFLLLQRDAAGKVHFQQLNALTFRLLDRIEQTPGLHAHTLLHELAGEARASSVPAFIEQGDTMLRQLRDAGILITMPAGEDRL
ncbi:MAG TPA: putative DNA-binding domain-containing protein [Lysobacter sp.]|nr:putative DNA-binding domain-containing protein [Lysobacter sp.]